jgi:hypothetical protein
MGLPVEVNNLMMGAVGGYRISRSLRFRSSASAYLNRTFGTPTNNKIWTWSGWVKRGSSGSRQFLSSTNTTGGSNAFYFEYDSSDSINIGDYGASWTWRITTTQVFRDPAAWYHLVLSVDTTQATASNRVKLYVNGVQVTAFSTATYPSQNSNPYWNSATYSNIGNLNGTSLYFDGYLAEVNFIDGQALTPSSFGETDSITGVWNPKKYSGTYGTNGFYLNFSDNSGATATTIGKDSSGNGNNWTPNNISVTAGTTYDSMIDSPTPYADGNSGRGNYAVLNPLQKVSGYAPDNGNLRSVMNATGAIFATIGVTTGKWYWENIYEVAPNGNMEYGVSLGTVSTSSQPGNVSGSWAYSPFNGSVFSQSGTPIATVATASLNDVIGLALDVDAGTLAIYKNNSLLYTITSISGGTLFPVIGGSSSINAQSSVNFGQRPFSYTPPSGYKALNSYNLPAASISNGAKHFAATTYTGNGSTQSISNAVNGVSFQPDLVWLKVRNQARSHRLLDSVRGATKEIYSDLTNAEATDVNGLTAFNSNGFSVGSSNTGNANADNYVGWQWKGGGTAVTNNSGTISSQVSANTSAGFSVVTYTGTGANATVGHGLGVAPSMVIYKVRSQAYNWMVYHVSVGATAALNLNLTAVPTTASTWFNNTAPTSSVLSIGTDSNVNQSSQTYVAYCFSAVRGFSSFGSYTGNGSTDGPFIYTGFRPRFILIKGSSFGSNWNLFDTSRNQYNVEDLILRPNSSASEFSGVGSSGGNILIDVLSNGFKIRDVGLDINTSGATLVYAAFAEVPFNLSRAR